MKEKFKKYINNPRIIFIFFLIIVFLFYKQLFQSYFEADEWFWFTNFLPLINNSNGAILAIIKSVTSSNALSAGQHVDPLGIEIFFLNILFFRLHFIPYVMISLFLHSINSFLVFVLIRELLNSSRDNMKNLLAITGGVFFALTAVPMHAVTWVAFYGQNVLSVTFFLLSILFLAKGLNDSRRRFIILSSLFLLLDLLTKETSVTLFLVIPFFVLLNKRVFSIKTLIKIYSLPLLFFIPFRFVLPLIYSWANNYASSSIHGGLLQSVNINLLLYRLASFPLKMISEVFFSYNTIQPFLAFITPFIYPQFGEVGLTRYQNHMAFIYGPGINLFVYILSIIIIILFLSLLLDFYKRKKKIEFKALLFGFFIIVVSALPLVLNVFNLEWWGIDFFDVRHYYMPSVGAAILFPFFIFNFGKGVSKFLRELKLSVSPLLITSTIFIIWFSQNLGLFNNFLETREKLAIPRKQILSQLKFYLPTLSKKTVIYVEPSLSAYFQTNIAQMLTVVYYDKSFPNEFFDRPSFWKTPEGYEEFKGKGFGYYYSKKDLLEAISQKTFSIDNIYGFYYNEKKNQLKDITTSLRKELEISAKETSR